MIHKKIYKCGNFDCRAYGVEHKAKDQQDCPYCKWSLLTKREFDDWTDASLANTYRTAEEEQAGFAGNGFTASRAPSKPNDEFTAPACLTGCPVALGP